MPQHSPAPWTAPAAKGDRWLRDAHGSGVAQLPAPRPASPSFPHLEAESGARIAADARLISAAPDMLAALVDVLARVVADRRAHGLPGMEDAARRAAAAIKAATGEEA